MATLISGNGDGNFATAATWKNVCTGTNAVLTTLTAAEAKTNTTYTYGVAFTVTNAENVEGFALHLKRSGTTGTLTVALSDDNGTTATKEVTVNLSDLPDQYSWVFFKFASVLAADGGTDYKVGIKLSVGSSGVSIYRGSATTGDWSHILREDSAPGSLSAGDVFYIMDAWTAAATKTTNTVTMNETATTDYGAITVGQGTLTFGTSASTNYYLKTSGDLTVWGGGTLNMGTTGTPMPSTSTAVLELDPTTDGEFGLLIKDGGTLVCQGASMTKVWDLLATDEAVNSTSWTTANSTGWKDNDVIAIASTSRTATDTEVGALNGDASGTTLTVDGFAGAGGGVAFAHSGTTPTQAEIINLTRNVKIRSATSTLMTYINLAAASIVDCDYAEFYYIGENAGNKRGLDMATTSAGSCSIQYCSIHDSEDNGVNVSGISGSVTFAWNVGHKLNTSQVASQNAVAFAVTSGVHTVTDNVFLNLQSSNQAGVSFLDMGSTFSRNRIAGCQGTATVPLSIGGNEAGGIAWDDNVIHSNVGMGVNLAAAILLPTTFSNWKVWRNGSYGITISQATAGYLTLYNWSLFGNTTANILQNGANFTTLDTCDIQSDASYTTTQGIYNTSFIDGLVLKNCTIGTTTAHVSYGINATSGRIRLYNTTIGDTVEVNTPTHLMGGVRSHKHDASETTYKNWFKYGRIDSDQTTRHTASGYSWKLTPNNATYKLVLSRDPESQRKYEISVNASAAVTITAYVYKDSSYNGNAPRLVLVGGYIGGIASDVVDSLTVAHSNWEQLSVSGTPNEAGVVEFYLDADGTAGSVYIDDISVSQA